MIPYLYGCEYYDTTYTHPVNTRHYDVQHVSVLHTNVGIYQTCDNLGITDLKALAIIRFQMALEEATGEE